MASRRSDRGRMLAKALREDPEFETGKMLAEFSEPYGTYAAADRIASGEGEALDYLAAVPVLGIPARYAKRFKKIGDAVSEAKKHKSREIVTEMDIDEFLNLAKPGLDPDKARNLQGVEQFDDVPYLNIDSGDGTGVAQVVGHEGRHRARALKEMGEKKMPVVLKDRHIRWDMQDRPNFDYIDESEWPTKLVSESGDVVGDFPIKQGDWGEAQRMKAMALRSKYTPQPPVPMRDDEVLQDMDELFRQLGID